MGLNFQMLRDEVQYELLIDFAKESSWIDIEGCYVKRSELKLDEKIRLYIDLCEEETWIYYFEDYSVDYLKKNITDNSTDECIFLKIDFLSKFDLVRVIPPMCHIKFDSYKRIKLKQNAGFAKITTMEDEMHKKK